MQDDVTSDDDETHDAIETLEARIATQVAEVARCRKLALAARVLIWGGGAALVLMLLQFLSSEPQMLLTALGAVIGGIVLAGSNASTWQQAEDALADAEAKRAALIGGMELRLVGDAPATLH